MTTIQIVPKTVEIMAARTALFSTLSWRTVDDSFKKRLVIIVNELSQIVIADTEYENLGQWTDDTILQIILTRFGLTVA